MVPNMALRHGGIKSLRIRGECECELFIRSDMFQVSANVSLLGLAEISDLPSLLTRPDPNISLKSHRSAEAASANLLWC